MMNSAISHAAILPFDTEIDPTSVGTRWSKWIQRFENFLVAMNIVNDGRKRALLLPLAGERVHDIYDTLAGEDDDFETTKTKLDGYFTPKKNTQYLVYKFRKAAQEQGENLDTYHTRLRMLSRDCEFTDVDSEIKAQIIQSCTSSRLRRRALREPEMTLETLLNFGRTLEISEQQAEGIEQGTSTAVNAIEHKYKPQMNDQRGNKNANKDTQCRNCGGRYPHRGDCPAKGKDCNVCGKPNHFAKVCRSNQRKSAQDRKVRHDHNKDTTYGQQKSTRRVNRVTASECGTQRDSSSSDDQYVFSVNGEACPKHPRTSILLNDVQVEVLIDSGAAVNIISENIYNMLKPQPEMKVANIKIFSYGSKHALPIMGVFECSVKAKDRNTQATFYVLKGSGHSLLSYDTASKLGLIQIINAVDPTIRSVSDELIDSHPELFTGIGKLKDFRVKLHINPEVQPTCQPHRRVPFHVRQKVEEELRKLEEDDIIERVTGPTPWVSPIVTPPKPKDPDQVGICVDMRQANVAIQRERHLTPTMDDVIHELNGARVFSKLDLNKGYHQLELHPDSRYITTFTTHLGLRRYKRLSFGISSAAEVFQNTICQVLHGIPGVKNLSDDIIVYGSSQKAHDDALRAVFSRLKECGLTLNRNKCELNKQRLEFFGFIFSADGISADPRKVAAIHKASDPKDPAEIRSLLGMANYCSRFIKDFSTITAPLRELTKKGAPWNWGAEHSAALQTLKERLTSDTTMSYFDPKKDTELVVDASPCGLGAILCQTDKGEKHVIAYASRALTDVERRYSQTEREALAIIWSCEHFHLYLYGNEFTLVTDHKPLELIWNNPKSKPPARIERWGLRLQPYDFKIVYRKGADNPADYMSRHPIPIQTSGSTRASKIAEEYVNFISLLATPKAMILDHIKAETLKDGTLQQVSAHIKNNSWHTITDNAPQAATLQQYKHVRNELTLSASEDLILRGCRIVIPSSLQHHVLELAHEGHQGIAKTKVLLREKVWFPGIDQRAEALIRNCLACQANTPVTRTEPLKMSNLPESPWHSVSADFYGPLPSGEYLMVIVDDYTRYPVVDILHSISSSVVIPRMDNIFSMFGIPHVVKTDNGPPFNGSQFSQFAQHMGFHHRKITPLWPQANATAERFMRTIGKVIRIAPMQGIPWKQQMNIFLREYRATPHCTTGRSPAELMFQRRLNTKIPSAYSTVISADKEVRKRDTEAKAKMKIRSDERRHAVPSHIKPGDNVLCRQVRQNKLTTPYSKEPLTVTNVKGSMVTAEQNGYNITRNSSFFKKIHPMTQQDQLPPPDYDLDPDPDDGNDQPEPAPTQPRYPVRQHRHPPAYLRDYE